MNDYIAKPVDERILYSKIIGLVKRPVQKIYDLARINESTDIKPKKCTDLTYLNGITKSDPKLMMEMITLYLEQTPVLIDTLKKALLEKNWDALHSAAHKMIPSFLIIGINPDYEIMAKKLQEYTGAALKAIEINTMVQQLESVCTQACKELEEEYNTLKYTNS